MIKTPLFWMFGSHVIFQMNKVWEANKPAKGELKQRKYSLNSSSEGNVESNGPTIKILKIKRGAILTDFDL